MSLLVVPGCLANGLPKIYADVDVYRLGAVAIGWLAPHYAMPPVARWSRRPAERAVRR